MNRARFLFALITLLMLINGCSLTNHHVDEPSSPLHTLTSVEKQIVRADNRFGLKLFRTISEAEEPGDNVFVSPLSVSMALGMTLNGARGDTRTAMQETLELADLSSEEINTSYKELIQLLTELDPKVTLDLANSIWYRNGFDVEQAFIDVNKEHFDAEVQGLEFSSPEALGTINRWVETQTQGKIDEIFKQIRSDEVMFLINALYFKGTWMYAFDETDTRDAPFTQHDGTETQVSMMNQTANLPYFESDAFQVVDLPYGDSLFSMTVLLPHEGHDVDTLVSTLDAEQWNAWTHQFEPRDVDLKLPRFTLEYEKELNDALKALGMTIAFSCKPPQAADFSGISAGGGLCISRAKHKTFVEVNEEGTEAAAVTSVGMQRESTGGATRMHVDRPFVFVIHEQHSGTILFAGKVSRL